MKKTTWSLVEVEASEIKPNPDNPKIRNDKGLRRLQKSLKKFGKVYDGICNKDFTLIDGHSRLELNETGKVKVFVPSRQLTPEEYKEMNFIFDVAKAGEPDWTFTDDWSDELKDEWELKEEEFDEIKPDSFEGEKAREDSFFALFNKLKSEIILKIIENNYDEVQAHNIIEENIISHLKEVNSNVSRLFG